MFFLFSSAIASSFLQESDMYRRPFPKEFEIDSIVFTTPAIQSMEHFNISPQNVLSLIKSHPKESCFTDKNITCILSGKRLISVIYGL
jgi:hypothetical protein